MWERKREKNRQRAMEERKCFACGKFGHMAYNCKNMGEEEPTQVFSNKFNVLKVRVMQRREESSKKVTKDRREILREEKAKGGSRGETSKGRKKREKGKIFERSNGEDWIEAGRGRERNCNRSIAE